jgi:hypothetical protein
MQQPGDYHAATRTTIMQQPGQDGELRGDGFSWYSDEDISENKQEIEKKPSGKL